MAGGVLVEQRVEEDGVERADAPLAVDQRDLAQARGALVAGGVARAATSAPSSASIRTARPPSNATSRPRMIDAADARAAWSRARRRRRASGSGEREDLLGREVRHVRRCRRPSRSARPCQRERRQQADGQVGARALEVQRVEAARGEPLGGARRARRRARARRRPGRPRRGGRRGRSAPTSRRERRVGRRGRGARAAPRPASGRAPIGPVGRAVVDDLAGLAQARQLVAARRGPGRGRRAGRARPGR